MADNREPIGRLSGDDVVHLTEQIMGLSEAGLPLPSGLRALALEQPSRGLAATLDGIADRLDAGNRSAPPWRRNAIACPVICGAWCFRASGPDG